MTLNSSLSPSPAGFRRSSHWQFPMLNQFNAFPLCKKSKLGRLVGHERYCDLFSEQPTRAQLVMCLGNTKEETVKNIILSAVATSALACAGGAIAQTTPMNTMSHMTSSNAMPAKTNTSHAMSSHKTISRTEEKTESKAQERSEAKAHSMRHHHHRRSPVSAFTF